MSKDKFKKRKDRRRLIRGEMTKRGISGKALAAKIGVSEATVSRYCATSPQVVAALIAAGVPAGLFDPEVREKAQRCAARGEAA